MGEKDIVEKTLESYNDVFADIFNVLLFNGKEVIKEDALTAATPYSMFKADDKLHEQARDVAKYWNNTVFQLSMFGIENQSCVDKTMPLRVFSYDGAAYKKQLLEQKEGSDHFFPVITIVLYFGKGKWTEPLKLSQVVDIPEILKPYVSDFKINVFSVAYITKKKRNMFKSDFKHVANFFYNNERNKEYKPSREEIKHVEEVLQLLKIFSGDKRFEDVYNEYVAEPDKWEVQGGNNMCYILDQIENRGINKGLKQGVQQGRLEGRQEGRLEGSTEKLEEIILKMLKNDFTDEQIKACTDVTYQELEKIKEKVACAVL